MRDALRAVAPMALLQGLGCGLIGTIFGVSGIAPAAPRRQ